MEALVEPGLFYIASKVSYAVPETFHGEFLFSL